MTKDSIIKKQLLFILRGGNAHIPINRAIHNFPINLINKKIDNINYTPWHLLEHISIAQKDILQFIKNPNYKSPDWPEGYWPPKDKMADENMWQKTIENIYSGLEEIERYIKDDAVDLFKPLSHAEQYTIYREALVLADHNSYHIGQFMMMQKILSGK